MMVEQRAEGMFQDGWNVQVKRGQKVLRKYGRFPRRAEEAVQRRGTESARSATADVIVCSNLG